MLEYLDLETDNGRLISVWPVPYEGTASFAKGTRNGPEAILKASAEIETWDQELDMDLADLAHFQTLPRFAPPVSGPEAVYQAMLRELEALSPADPFVLTLGGEHSVALAPIQMYRRLFPDLVVLQLDAHADLRPSFQGSDYSHACVMARARDLGLPLVQVGIRSLSREESRVIRDAPKDELLTLFAHQLPKPEEAAAMVRDFIQDRPVYISFDADALDPSILPGTGTPEPGGLSFTWVQQFWPQVLHPNQLVGMDFCELAPLPAAGVVSESVAVRCVNRILVSSLRSNPQPGGNQSHASS